MNINRRLTLIGTGATAKVYASFNHRSTTALKIFDPNSHMQNKLTEIAIMNYIHHPNLMSALHTYINPDDSQEMAIEMEYYPFDLSNYIKQFSINSITQIKSITYQILCGLNYLHSCGVIHRDLKPANILIRENSIKICDYSHSMTEYIENCQLETNEVEGILESPLTTHVTTRSYRAPEVILMQKYSYPIDTWATGCILGELLLKLQNSQYTGPIFNASSCFPLSPCSNNSEIDSYDLLRSILRFKGPLVEDDLSFILDNDALNYIKEISEDIETIHPFNAKFMADYADSIAMFADLTQFNPNKRPQIASLLEDPYFASVRRMDCEYRLFDKLVLPILTKMKEDDSIGSKIVEYMSEIIVRYNMYQYTSTYGLLYAYYEGDTTIEGHWESKICALSMVTGKSVNLIPSLGISMSAIVSKLV